jgi:transposase
MKPDWLQHLPQDARRQAESDLGRLAFLEKKVALLEEMLRLRRLERYGRRSEKCSDEQLFLLSLELSLNAAELAQEASLAASQKEGLESSKPAEKKKKRPHPGREPLPAHLPRQEVVIACTPEQTACPICHQPNPVIGYDQSEELCVKPAQYYVKVTKREKRACRLHPEGGVATAPIPSKILPKSKLSDEVIVDTVVRKYQWHQPLYRQAAMLEREAGVKVDRHTLDDGVMWVGQLLHVLKAPMREEVFGDGYLQADETPVGVKTPLVQGGSHRAYLFEYSQPRAVVVYDFRMGRGREGPREFLEGFVGTLQCDGYAGYDQLESGTKHIVRAGCWAHARRYFDKAHKVAPQETDALSVVIKMRELYQVEEQAREERLDAKARLALRTQKSAPVVAELKTQIQKLQEKALPQSALGRACKYALGQWERLEVFLKDGKIEIDNNRCEQGMRPVALGRKNWMLIGSEAAGPKVAAILSVIETCRRLNIDVRRYLKDVLPQLAQWPLPQVSLLTPKAWLQRQPKQQTS